MVALQHAGVAEFIGAARGKLGEVNVISLTLLVTPHDGKTKQQKMRADLVLHSKLAFLLFQFASSAGQYEHGSGKPLKIDWSKIPGSAGFCVLKHRAYKNKDGQDRISVEVDKWLDSAGRAGANDKAREMTPEVAF
jgi:hypothetical protein